MLAAIYLLRGRSGREEEESLVPRSVPSPEPESRPLPVPRSIAPVSDYAPPPPRRVPEPVPTGSHYSPAVNSSPVGGKAALMGILKEEMFAIESERLSGTLSQQEYAEIKMGLEAVLKRALRKT